MLVTKTDAQRTLQTSILTRHEADKTRGGSRTGRPSQHMFHRDGGPGREGKVKRLNAKYDKRDEQAYGQTNGRKSKGEKNNKQRGGGGGWMLKGTERLCMKGRRERGG